MMMIHYPPKTHPNIFDKLKYQKRLVYLNNILMHIVYILLNQRRNMNQVAYLNNM